MLKYPLTISRDSKVRFTSSNNQINSIKIVMEKIDIEYDDTIALMKTSANRWHTWDRSILKLLLSNNCLENSTNS
jgi:hypothetical protein